MNDLGKVLNVLTLVKLVYAGRFVAKLQSFSHLGSNYKTKFGVSLRLGYTVVI